MTTYDVKFLPDDVTFEVEEGTNLLQTAMSAGVHVNASCGGGGVCGKCRVILEEGQVESERSSLISEEDFEAGYRQACESKVLGDVVVRVPVESQLEARALNRPRPGKNAARMAEEIGVDQLREEGIFSPPLLKKIVHVAPPTLGDNISDLTRVIDALRDQHGVHNLNVDFKVIKTLPEIMRDSDFETTVTLAFPPSYVEDPEGARINLTDIQAGDHTASNYALAVDVGTTTVFGQLLDLHTGQVLDTYGDFNRQISYGEDVITRIIYADKTGGLKKMQDLIVTTINSIIDILCKRQKVDPEEITVATMAGNTTMTQLLLGVNPKYIRLAPYVPTANFLPPISARGLGFHLGEHVMVHVFPSVASYVGGDIVAGLIASGVNRREELTLFIDLGTNGEIVVGNKDWMASAACSAGPAFEGGGIKFGMRAISGAIEDFSINPSTLEPMILTIDMKKPKGICGSGLINTVAGLFEMGVLEANGKYNRDLDTNRVRSAGDDGYEYVLSWADETEIDQDIVLTEVDIDNFIRAKGAMYAGYMTLLEEVGLTISDLERVIIAGGFGRYINLEKAIITGLLPEMDLDKFTFIGNGSLLGAKLNSLSNHLRQEVKEIVSKITNFELSEVPTYMGQYVAAQFLPHTDQDSFANVMARVAETRGLVRRKDG
ncbi:MAG: ASKHA domain-containing protein [Candidatus Adiutricales bacterium]